MITRDDVEHKERVSNDGLCIVGRVDGHEEERWTWYCRMVMTEPP